MIVFSLQQFALLGVLSAAVHWLLARSDVMGWFWSRVTGRLDQLLRCPACSGFWIGLGLGAAGLRPVTTGYDFVDALTSGLLALYATPVAEGVLIWGLAASEVEDEPPEPRI